MTTTERANPLDDQLQPPSDARKDRYLSSPWITP